MDRIEASIPQGQSGNIAAILVGLEPDGVKVVVMFHDQTVYSVTVEYTTFLSMFEEFYGSIKKDLGI